MSDLQCAARLHLAAPDESDHPARAAGPEGGQRLTDARVRQVHELAARLRPLRISTVYSSAAPWAVQSAQVAAEDLGVATRVVDDLQELDEGLPGEDGEHAVVARFKGALEEIADLHRGEDVLVFSHSRVMSRVLPQLLGTLRADPARSPLEACVSVQVDVDADGWRVRGWPGATGAATATATATP